MPRNAVGVCRGPPVRASTLLNHCSSVTPSFRVCNRHKHWYSSFMSLFCKTIIRIKLINHWRLSQRSDLIAWQSRDTCQRVEVSASIVFFWLEPNLPDAILPIRSETYLTSSGVGGLDDGLNWSIAIGFCQSIQKVLTFPAVQLRCSLYANPPMLAGCGMVADGGAW